MRLLARSGAALLSALFVLVPGTGAPAAAADVPDAATLRGLVDAAQGPVPANFRETVVSGTTTRTTFHRGADVRAVVDRGPIRTEQGFYRWTRWHQDANGLTVIDDRVAAGVPPATTATVVKRVTAPVSGYLVESLDANGYGTRQFIDPETYAVMRTERIDAGGTVVTSNEAFAVFGARRLPARWTISDSRTNATVTETRTDYREGAVTEGDVATPPICRTLVQFPAGAASVKLPVRFVGDRVYVQVTVGGRDLDFVLDTGESGISISEDVARELGLPLFNKSAQFQAGRFAQFDTLAPSVEIGQLAMHDIVMTTIPQLPALPKSELFAGILGFDFLAELGVTIDYAHRTVTVAPALRWRAPRGPDVVELPVHLMTGTPLVRVALNGQVGERFVLDTGANTSLLITSAFARRHGALFAGPAQRAPYNGIGGSFDVNRYVMRDVAIARIAFRDVSVLRADASDPYATVDGIIGTNLLHFFTVDLHYADGMVYLTRNSIVPAYAQNGCSAQIAALVFRTTDCSGGENDRAPDTNANGPQRATGFGRASGRS